MAELADATVVSCLQDEALKYTSKQQPQGASKAGRKQQGGSSGRAAAAAASDSEQELFCSAFGYGTCAWLCCGL
jgi:hypothetical protein